MHRMRRLKEKNADVEESKGSPSHCLGRDGHDDQEAWEEVPLEVPTLVGRVTLKHVLILITPATRTSLEKDLGVCPSKT